MEFKRKKEKKKKKKKEKGEGKRQRKRKKEGRKRKLKEKKNVMLLTNMLTLSDVKPPSPLSLIAVYRDIGLISLSFLQLSLVYFVYPSSLQS